MIRMTTQLKKWKQKKKTPYNRVPQESFGSRANQLIRPLLKQSDNIPEITAWILKHLNIDAYDKNSGYPLSSLYKVKGSATSAERLKPEIEYRLIWVKRCIKPRLRKNKKRRNGLEKTKTRLGIDFLFGLALASDVCPVSGKKMWYKNSKMMPEGYVRASLDRIDSNKGYTKENVRIIGAEYNLLKNKLSYQEICIIQTYMQHELTVRGLLVP